MATCFMKENEKVYPWKPITREIDESGILITIPAARIWTLPDGPLPAFAEVRVEIVYLYPAESSEDSSNLVLIPRLKVHLHNAVAVFW